MKRLFEATGKYILGSVQGAGYSSFILIEALSCCRHAPSRWREIIRLMFLFGVKSIPVTAIVAVFTGMILSLQTGIELTRIGQQARIGTIVAVVMCREMGPFITGLILTACVGSAMAAELGTMKVSEEIDALEVMAIDPISFLVTPRLLALTLMCPILTVLANIIGIFGGGIVAQPNLGVSLDLFFHRALESLRNMDETFGIFPKDIYTGLFKSVVFGLTISTIGCAQGLRAYGGALGVGRATRNSVVVSFVMIIILSYFLTWIFYH